MSEDGISLDDITEIWGTPLLDKGETYFSENDYRKLTYHSICHLFSGLLYDTANFYADSIIALAVDGGPDYVVDVDMTKKSYAGSLSRSGEILDVFPVYSPGMLWAEASKYFKLKEGTLMALASASSSTLWEDNYELPLYDSRPFNVEAYNFIDNIYKKVEKLSDADKGVLFSGYDDQFSIEDNNTSMVMKIIQKISIEIMELNLDTIIKKHNLNPAEYCLSITGGYALNCITNQHLMKKYKFKKFIAPPCVNDSGMSLGIGLHTFYKRMEKFDFILGTPFYGYSETYEKFIDENKECSKYISYIEPLDYKTAVQDIKNTPIVWFNGDAEIGPRALGNRSILADPTTVESKNRLNIIKQRQWWRPVAPIIAEEHINEWFDEAYLSPYMLHTFKINDQYLDLLPAISHLDSSARVQTVKESEYPVLHELLLHFKEETGLPLLCNTSLNDRGEPIINSIEETLNFALRKKIPVIYINTFRITINLDEEFRSSVPSPRYGFLWTKFHSFDEKEKMKKELNPFNLPNDVILHYLLNNTLYSEHDLTNEADVKFVTRHYKMFDKLVKKSGES